MFLRLTRAQKRLIVILVLSLFFFSSCANSSLQSKYDELYDKYLALEDQYSGSSSSLEESLHELEKYESEYNSLHNKLWSLEDDSLTVYCYFEDENDVSFDEAYDAYQRIKTLWSY